MDNNTNKSDRELEFNYQDELGSWNIIYPIKVYDSSVDRSKETQEQAVQSAILLLGLGSLLLFLFLNSVFKATFGISSFWAFLIVLVLVSVISIYVFRFCIFKEDAKFEEFTREDTDNLGRFYEILNGVEDSVKLGRYIIPLHKFSNGQYMCCIKLRHGSSNAVKRVATKEFMEDLSNILGRYNLVYKQLIMGEEYEETPEYEEYISSINKMSNKKLQKTLIDIATYTITKSNAMSLVDCTYVLVYAKNSYQKYTLATALADIIQLYQKTKTVYRDIDFLDSTKFIEVAKKYYGVDVIDLSTIRATTPNRNILMQYGDFVGTVSVDTVDGRTIHYEDVLKDYLTITNVKDL